MKRLVYILAIFSSWSAIAAVPVEAESAGVIAKARTFVGTETALQSLKSVHYMGFLETVDDENGQQKPLKLGIDIIFQKPYQQRITVTAPGNVETTALDDYEAWRRQQDPGNPANWRMSLLTVDQVKRLRANAWENLAFYRGLESHGGKVEDRGESTVSGIKCRKLAFVHDPSVTFLRYFNDKTGQLVLTETEEGSTIREEGEIVVNGIRFPERIVTTNKGTDGHEHVVTIRFEKVLVNEPFPPSTFRVPIMQPSGTSAGNEPPKTAK